MEEYIVIKFTQDMDINFTRNSNRVALPIFNFTHINFINFTHFQEIHPTWIKTMLTAVFLISTGKYCPLANNDRGFEASAKNKGNISSPSFASYIKNKRILYIYIYIYIYIYRICGHDESSMQDENKLCSLQGRLWWFFWSRMVAKSIMYPVLPWILLFDKLFHINFLSLIHLLYNLFMTNLTLIICSILKCFIIQEVLKFSIY